MHRLGYSYRRARRVPPKSPPPAQVGRVERALVRLHRLEQAGKCHVWYGDESGFCLQPVVPYLWQKKGRTLGLPSAPHGKRLNALGFLSGSGRLHSVTTTATVTAETFIATIEAWLPTLTRPSVLVLDNASVHKSVLVRERWAQWREKGLRLLFLPPYSPHLNRIERVWRMMKYHWLSPSAYANFATLQQSVTQLLKQVGDKYHISFA